MPLLEARHLVKTYAHSAPAVDDVSFTIERGQTLGLVGESGSGKSTIARMVMGLIPPTSGDVLFDNISLTTLPPRRLRLMRRRLQIVFQDPYAALNPRMRVRDIVVEPLIIHRVCPRSELRARASELLHAAGLDDSALPRYPHEFSGGQRQRINIARALALRPELIVLDEPLSALDVSVAAQIANLLRDLQREFSLTYLFISHSMPMVRYLSTRIAVLHHGRMVEYGDAAQICTAPRDPYTQTLIAATPEIRIA
ncbi:MAG TPA: ATP-binding cassette domain-containing protein [Acidobacteriaceae bacterium]|nr:ATP-binding cassette domain-containing protein [Acidobacteriaceae bacterium]